MDERIRGAIAAAREAAAVDREALAARLRPDVARWRHPAKGAEPHRPEPWYSERGGTEARWAGSSHRPTSFVGFDAGERPLLSEIRWGERFGSRLDEVWRHGDGWSEGLFEHEACRYEFEGGRLALAATSAPGLELWTYDGDIPVRGNLAAVGGDHLVAEAYVAEVDPDGRLRTLRRGVEILDRGGLDEEAALERALRRARELEPADVVFDYRRHRFEPSLRDTGALVELLAPAIERAVVDAVSTSGVPHPFVVSLGVGRREWPPFLRVGGDAFRRKVTALVPDDGAAVSLLYRAAPPDGADIDLIAHLDEEALRACRELTGALSSERHHADPERERAGEASERIGRALAERLNRRDWPGAAEPFLALVHIGRPLADVDPYALAAQGAGRKRIRSFERSLVSRRGTPPPPPEAARGDRGALERLLAARGLDAHAHRLAHEVARRGYRLVAGEGAGHLGGPPLLPPGEPWPDGLTFLAGIDTRTIESLPAGWMLFFADPEAWIDEGEGARFYFTDEPVPAEGPALRGRPVRADATLTLPTGYDLDERLGLDVAEAEVCREVAEWLRYDDDFSFGDADHWVLGSISDVQGEGLGDGDLLLLHLASDGTLGFEYLDGGALRFHAPRDAIAAGDWSRVIVEGSSA